MTKRYRRRTAKPGQLIAYYGKIDGSEDICYAWGGDGASKADSHLIHGMFSGYEYRKHGRSPSPHDGYLEALEARGYDLTTLRFSIQKKQQMPLASIPK